MSSDSNSSDPKPSKTGRLAVTFAMTEEEVDRLFSLAEAGKLEGFFKQFKVESVTVTSPESNDVKRKWVNKMERTARPTTEPNSPKR